MEILTEKDESIKVDLVVLEAMLSYIQKMQDFELDLLEQTLCLSLAKYTGLL